MERLGPNAEQAKAMYFPVISRLKPYNKPKVVKAMEKLQNLGYTDYLEDLSSEEQEPIFSSIVKHFLAWWIVWNLSSKSSPCPPYSMHLYLLVLVIV